MRRLLILLFMIALAACQQQTALPTPAELDATEAPSDDATEEARPTDAVADILGQLPPPGTAIIPMTEEAESDPAQVPFTMIFYEERGGINDTELFIEIYQDGRVVRNGEESQISVAQIGDITQALSDSHFFGLEGVFTRPGAPSSDVYSYAVTVTLENGSERRVDAQDGLVPPELQQLFSVLRQVGEGS